VVDRLVTAQALLAPGLRLLVVAGYRPADMRAHVTGAAVDLTLCSVDGGELWMGAELHDTDGPACHMAWPHLDREAVANRERLSRALRGAGLVNYPIEWWHWSYGDRYWAYATQAPSARYGPVAGTSLNRSV
jgi:D-alanyl-D-alanine dipeptidase